MNANNTIIYPACICGQISSHVAAVYKTPPAIEVKFPNVNYDKYYRELIQCDYCNHFMSVMSEEFKINYSNDYVNAHYSDIAGIHKNFQRIINLPASKSDNARRVGRIKSFVREFYENNFSSNINLLDIGSGLGVFPYAVKQLGWDCTALDPDSRTIEHIAEFIGVKTIQGDFMRVNNPVRYDIITFNRVLEHVDDPVLMLKRSKDFLADNGIVYIEVPDGEEASKAGFEREEFTYDHPHVFSLTSLSILAIKAKLKILKLQRGIDPSGKFSLWAFAGN